MLLVFDIESVPDTRLLREYFKGESWACQNDDLRLCEAAFDAQAAKTNSSFLPVPFHRIISIAGLIGDEFGRFERVGNFGAKEIAALLESSLESRADIAPSELYERIEKIILSEFLKFMNKHNPRLVSFNGRNFDLPAILVRALKHGLSATAYFEKNNPAANKTKWDNYRARYCEEFHLDLMDSLSCFGAARGMGLDMLCVMAGAVGKYDIDGSCVHEIFYGDFGESSGDSKGGGAESGADFGESNGDFGADSNVDSKESGADFDVDSKEVGVDFESDFKESAIDSKKPATDSKKSAALNLSAKLAKIDAYCQSDVLNTYWLFLKYEVLSGNLTHAQYGELLSIFEKRLPANAEYSEIFAKKIKSELKCM